jgi:hypothetical protein
MSKEGRPWERKDWTNPDPGAQKVGEILELGEKGVAYTWFMRVRSLHASWFAYPYVGTWLAILLILFSGSPWWSKFDGRLRWLVVAPIVIVAIYRLLEVLRWWLDLILDRRHFLVVARERNLIFLAINLVEVVFVGAILFRVTSVSNSMSGCWFASFFLVTQLALPAGVELWQQASKVLVEIASLVLLLGGLSALVELVGSKLREGPWKGPLSD